MNYDNPEVKCRVEVEIDDIVADRIFEVLNRALRNDKESLSALFRHRVVCNKDMANDETIQVAKYKETDEYTLGVMGLLSGLTGTWKNEGPYKGFSRVASVYDVECPIHGANDEANKECVVGDMCKHHNSNEFDECGKTLVPGELIRFDKLINVTPPVDDETEHSVSGMMDGLGPLPVMHKREKVVREAELFLSNAIHNMRWKFDLTQGEMLRVVNKEMSNYIGNVAKYAIRAERHGDTDKPGGIA